MTRNFHTIWVFTLVACGQSGVLDGGKSPSYTSSSSNSPLGMGTTYNGEMKEPGEGNAGPTIMIPETAENESVSIPSPITGSQLQCGNTLNANRQIFCFVVDADGDRINFATRSVFLVDGVGLQKETTWSEDDQEGYLIDVPGTYGPGFGVTLQNADESVTSLVKLKPATYNLVQDGSFEGFSLNGADEAVFSNSESPVWKVQKSDTSTCTDGSRLKIQRSANSGSSIDGAKRLELDSICGGDKSKGQNTVVSQEIKTTAGNSYELSFAMKRRQSDTGESKLRAKFGDDVVLTKKIVNDQDWETFRVTVKASAASMKLSFEERGTEDGVGTLIDGVKVIDLGVIP